MFYQDPKVIEALIEINENRLKTETDPAIVKQIEIDIQSDKRDLERALKTQEKLNQLKELAHSRVGKVTKLGEFEVTSNKLIITDPCYTKGTWCQGMLENPVQGKWHAYIQYRDEGDWGIRNSTIVAVHESCRLQDAVLSGYLYENHLSHYLNANIGVDSGQAGIFDWDKFPNEDPGTYGDKSTFYGRVCRATLPDDNYGSEPKDNLRAGVVPEGCVSSSGDGDGSYRCFYNKNSEGKVDAVEISFYWHDNEIAEEEESEDD